ncbi:hypothetical protein HAX54_037120, partial [Datura stramonium]|nr:hypothetical protein [Datura stramonium]
MNFHSCLVQPSKNHNLKIPRPSGEETEYTRGRGAARLLGGQRQVARLVEEVDVDGSTDARLAEADGKSGTGRTERREVRRERERPERCSEVRRSRRIDDESMADCRLTMKVRTQKIGGVGCVCAAAGGVQRPM